MQDNTPHGDEIFEGDVVNERPRQEVVKVESFPALKADQSIQIIKESVQIYLKSGLLPNHVKDWATAFTIAMYGKELGLSPLEAFQDIYVVKQKPAMSAKLMKRRVHEKLPNAVFDIIEHTESIAKVRVARDRQDEPTEWTMTREEADKAGWTKDFKGVKDNWAKQPETMLLYRLISKVCRMVFPDCLGSIAYTPEELGFEEGPKIVRERPTDDLDQFNKRMKQIGESLEVKGE